MSQQDIVHEMELSNFSEEINLSNTTDVFKFDFYDSMPLYYKFAFAILYPLVVCLGIIGNVLVIIRARIYMHLKT